MKTLLLMRHAKSSRKDKERPDYDRPLAKRGKHDIPRIADKLGAEGLRPDQIITSSARRARKTAQRLAAAIDFQQPVERRDELYMASLETWLQAVRHLKNSVSTVLFVGHNPGLEGFVELLAGEFIRLPTAAILAFEFHHNNWSTLEPADRRLKVHGVWRPKELTKMEAASDEDGNAVSECAE
ncbi:MAG: histidine phosphatase family protein [Planctomycetaceae bacterium]